MRPVALSRLAQAARMTAGPVAGAAAAALPVLPHGLQTPVAAALYVTAALRLLQRFAGGRGLPSTNRLSEAVGLATGHYERTVDLWRMFGSAFGVIAGLLAADPLLGLLGLGISGSARLDRTIRVERDLLDHQNPPRVTLTPEGWERQEAGAVGVWGLDVPRTFHPSDLLVDSSPDYAAGVPERKSFLPLLQGLALTVGMTFGIGRRALFRTEGFLKTLREIWKTIRTDEQFSSSPKVQLQFDRILPLWALRLARIYGMTIRFEGFERLREIPPDAHTVIFSARHHSIWPDFVQMAVDPRARPAADAANFRFNRWMKRVGFAWILDKMGAPAVPRGTGQREAIDAFYTRVEQDVMTLGTHPLFFGPGGRIPRAFDDSGRPAPAGLYANAPDRLSEKIFLKPGGTVRLSERLVARGDVYIVILDIAGTERVMPKETRAPFLQPIKTGQTVTFRVPKVIRIPRGTKVRPTILGRQLIDEARRVADVDGMLEETVALWTTQAQKPALAQAFKDKATKEVLWYVVADRIRSIHPHHRDPAVDSEETARLVFKERLIGLLEGQPWLPDDTLDKLLTDVTRVLRETEYRKWEEAP